MTIFFILQEIELEKKVDALIVIFQNNEEKRESLVLLTEYCTDIT